MTTTEQNWRDVIDGICQKRGWTIGELADRLRVHPNTVTKWRSPKAPSRPGADMAATLTELAAGGRAPRRSSGGVSGSNNGRVVAKVAKAPGKPATKAKTRKLASVPTTPPAVAAPGPVDQLDDGSAVFQAIMTDQALTSSQRQTLAALRFSFLDINRLVSER